MASRLTQDAQIITPPPQCWHLLWGICALTTCCLFIVPPPALAPARNHSPVVHHPVCLSLLEAVAVSISLLDCWVTLVSEIPDCIIQSIPSCFLSINISSLHIDSPRPPEPVRGFAWPVCMEEHPPWGANGTSARSCVQEWRPRFPFLWTLEPLDTLSPHLYIEHLVLCD